MDALSLSLGIRNSPVVMKSADSEPSLTQSLNKRSWDISDREVGAEVSFTNLYIDKGKQLKRSP